MNNRIGAIMIGEETMQFNSDTMQGSRDGGRTWQDVGLTDVITIEPSDYALDLMEDEDERE